MKTKNSSLLRATGGLAEPGSGEAPARCDLVASATCGLGVDDDALTPTQIRAALDLLLSHSLFASAKRSSQLLRYLVEEVLAGRGKGISEYAIALDVFGRSADFDRCIDTCVRTEAWRLRSRLDRYYETQGRHDPVRFTFAARSFVPSFKTTPRPEPIAMPMPAQPEVRRVFIHVECEAGSNSDLTRFAQRLSEELANALYAVPLVVPVLAKTADEGDLRLRCAVRSESDCTRIVASLIDEKDAVRGAKTFSFKRDSKLGSPLVVADDVSGMVQRSMSDEVQQTGVDLLDQPEETCFLDRLLRGAQADRGQRLAALRKDAAHQEKVIADDPLDRLSHRRLISTLGQFLALMPGATRIVMPKLGSCANAALSLDERLGDVWLTLGFASSYAHDWSQTERACRQAISIAPLDPSGYILMTLTYLQTGQVAQALELAEVVMALDPFSPMVANVYALTLNCARRFQEASDVAANALMAEPGFVKLRLTLGEALLNMGKIEAAIEEFETAHAMIPDDTAACGLLGFAYGLRGNRDGAANLLSKLRQSPHMRGQTIYSEAIINIGIGARDEAILALGQAVERRGTPGLVLANPTFDALREDSRFLHIQRQLEQGNRSVQAAA